VSAAGAVFNLLLLCLTYIKKKITINFLSENQLLFLSLKKKLKFNPSSFRLTTAAAVAAAIASRQTLLKEKSRKGEREEETAYIDNNSE